MDQLFSTTDVARHLGVGVSSVKRWTDEGLLAAVRTAGGHRRYTLEALHNFAQALKLDVVSLPPLPETARTPGLFARTEEAREALIAALDRADASGASALIQNHVASSDSRARFLDEVIGGTLRAVGEKWSEGKWTIESEHRASYLVAEALESLRPGERTVEGSMALLACPPGEMHELPLRMIRLVLEWNGWRTDYLGADLPWDALRRTVEESRPRLLLLTSRSREPFETDSFRAVAKDCSRWNTTVGIGGEWARGGGQRDEDEGVARFRTLAGFERWLRSLK